MENEMQHDMRSYKMTLYGIVTYGIHRCTHVRTLSLHQKLMVTWGGIACSHTESGEGYLTIKITRVRAILAQGPCTICLKDA